MPPPLNAGRGLPYIGVSMVSVALPTLDQHTAASSVARQKRECPVKRLMRAGIVLRSNL